MFFFLSSLTANLSKILGNPKMRVSCFKQQAGKELPYHRDLGQKVSFNIVLNDSSSPITFEGITPIKYDCALLNVSKRHSVGVNKNDRIIIKYLLDEISYDYAKKKFNQR